MSMHRTGSRTCLLAIALLAPLSHAQSVPTVPGQVVSPTPPGATGNGLGIRSLDEGREDVGPLGSSFLLQPLDLLSDQGFSRIYHVDDGSGRFQRRDNAITAVFPRSDYVQFDPPQQNSYVAPVIPPGTVWYIGDPIVTDRAQVPIVSPTGRPTSNWANLARPAGDGRIVNDLHAPVTGRLRLAPDRPAPENLSENRSAEGEETARAEPSRPIRKDVFTNEPYRKRRIHEMTNRQVLEIIEDDRDAIQKRLEEAIEQGN